MKRLLLIGLLGALPALPQAGSIDVKGSAGVLSFVDEDWEGHTLLGGSARFYITRRLSVEPEFLYLRQNRFHHDIVAIPHVNFDLLTGRVAPYLSIGAGVMRSKFGGPLIHFTETEGFIQGGGGAKIYVTDRLFVAPDFRVGLDFHARFSVGVGYSFRR